jgi:4-hydroxybenzoyl-CoA thioesterase
MIEPTEQVLDTSPFVVRRRVRWGECDPAGVVYTGKFTDYLLSAVMLFHEHMLGDFTEAYRKKLGIETPCKGLTLTFSRALWPNETFDMTVCVGDIRTSSYDVQVRAALPDGTPVFAGTFSPVCIPRNERRAIPIPDEMRERLLANQAPSA